MKEIQRASQNTLENFNVFGGTTNNKCCYFPHAIETLGSLTTASVADLKLRLSKTLSRQENSSNATPWHMSKIIFTTRSAFKLHLFSTPVVCHTQQKDKCSYMCTFATSFCRELCVPVGVGSTTVIVDHFLTLTICILLCQPHTFRKVKTFSPWVLDISSNFHCEKEELSEETEAYCIFTSW